jgi:hypothetical protein
MEAAVQRSFRNTGPRDAAIAVAAPALPAQGNAAATSGSAGVIVAAIEQLRYCGQFFG